jgi:thiamine biosynthesis protein ThiS
MAKKQRCVASSIPPEGDRRRLQVKINGERRMVEGQMTLSELIESLALAPERLAIELNQRVVRRADWPHTPLKDGDRIEIVHFVGGGEEQG